MTVPAVPTTTPPVQPKKKSKRKWILIAGGILSACCLLSILAAALSSPSSKTDTKAPVVAGESQTKPDAGKAEAAQVKPTEPPAATVPPAATETAAPELKSVYLVGEKASQAGIAITVLNVQKVNKLSLFTAEAGKTYLDIEVLIENVSRDETTPYNSMYFKVKDDTAAEYTTALASIEPSLKSGDLVKGDKARGHVAFEVPEGAKGFVASYEPMVIFGGYKTIRVNLDQKSETAPEIGTLVIGESQVGQRLESAGIGITVLAVNTSTSISSMAADAGMVYLDIEVLLENVSRDESTPYNPFYFKIKDAQFLEYNTALASLDPSLTSGELVKGDKVRGHVAFQVPADSKKFLVSYEPEVLFGGYKPITINVVLP